MTCRVFSSIGGLYPPDAIATPARTIQNASRLQKSWGPVQHENVGPFVQKAGKTSVIEDPEI